jgi:Tfp pilus assembly protein PilO
MEEKQKLAVSVLVVLLLLGIMGGVIYLKIKQKGPLDADIERLRQTIKIHEQKIAQIGPLTERIAALQDEIARYEVIIPDEEELDKMADTVEEFRKKSGVEINDFRNVTRPFTARQEMGQAYRRVSYNIKLTADFFEFATFVNLLENHERFIRVDSFRVSPARGEDTSLMDIDLQISTFTSRSPEAKIPAGASL